MSHTLMYRIKRLLVVLTSRESAFQICPATAFVALEAVIFSQAVPTRAELIAVGSNGAPLLFLVLESYAKNVYEERSLDQENWWAILKLLLVLRTRIQTLLAEFSHPPSSADLVGAEDDENTYRYSRHAYAHVSSHVS